MFMHTPQKRFKAFITYGTAGIALHFFAARSEAEAVVAAHMWFGTQHPGVVPNTLVVLPDRT